MKAAGLIVAGLIVAFASVVPLPPSPMRAPSSPSSPSAEPADLPRAQQLYENQCTACHECSLHERTDRRARNSGEVRAWVRHWANYEKLGWSEEEVADVSDYLVRRYYGFGATAPAKP